MEYINVNFGIILYSLIRSINYLCNMKNHLIFYFFIFLSSFLFAQKKPTLSKDLNFKNLNNSLNDSLKQNKERAFDYDKKATYKDYTIINYKNDSIYLDTTLSIKKDYKFNFLRKDNFELLPFHNQGQVANNLSYLDNSEFYPNIGATAKHLNYYRDKDINHFQVATPTTELAWRTGFSQGQFLDALITVNLKKNQNLFIAYKGMRSLGKYRSSLTSHGNLRTGFSYTSPNKKYRLKTHLIAQDLTNDESGGLTDESILNFETNNPDFKDGGRLVTNLDNAKNVLRGNTYYLNQVYILNKKDSISNAQNKIQFGHLFHYETKHYEYYETTSSDFFGDSFNGSTKDKSELKKLTNQVSTKFNSKYVLGEFTTYIENTNLTYQLNHSVHLNNQTIPQSITANLTSLGAKWKAKINRFKLNANVKSTIIGDLNNSYFKANLSYQKDSLFGLKAGVKIQDKTPNFNYLLHQSNYLEYNWFNHFKNIKNRNLLLNFNANKLINVSVNYTNIDNYTYFGNNNTSQISAYQFNETINYLKIKVTKELKFRKFSLDNTIMYQKVSNNASNVLNIPQLVTRNTLYYSNYLFKKKPMFLQTGITFKYFTKYNANNYNPLLAEFTVQNEVEIGNYPVIDLFANARIRQTRIFLKAEHINTLFSNKRDYYSAPTYPYRDFVIRFGIVWNFFL